MVFLRLLEAAFVMMFALNSVTVAMMSGRFVHVSNINAYQWTFIINLKKNLLFV